MSNIMGASAIEILEEISNKTEWLMPLQSSFDFVKNELEQLEKYKAIEEEIGIDLITLFKALKDGLISELNTDNKCKCHLEKGIYGSDNDYYLVVGYEHPSWYCLKDYGKTWALTKEELEE